MTEISNIWVSHSAMEYQNKCKKPRNVHKYVLKNMGKTKLEFLLTIDIPTGGVPCSKFVLFTIHSHRIDELNSC